MSQVWTEPALASVPSAVLVRVSGELDLVVADDVQESLESAGDGNAVVVADLSDVTFMDCRGLGALVHARVTLGGRLTLYEPPPTVLRLLELSHLRDTFVIIDERIRQEYPVRP